METETEREDIMGKIVPEGKNIACNSPTETDTVLTTKVHLCCGFLSGREQHSRCAEHQAGTLRTVQSCNLPAEVRGPALNFP